MIEFLRYGSNLSPLIPITIGIITFTRERNRTLLFAFLLILNSLLADWIAYYLAIRSISNYAVINIYFLIELVLLFLFYMKVLTSKIPVYLCVFLLLYFIYSYALSNINHYLASYISVHVVINILICLLFFFEFYRTESFTPIENQFQFWIVTGLLFYYSGSLFTIILSHEILRSPLPWSFTHIANILKNLLFSIGFLIAFKYNSSG